MAYILEHIAAQARPVEVVMTHYGPLHIRLYEGPIVRADNFFYSKPAPIIAVGTPPRVRGPSATVGPMTPVAAASGGPATNKPLQLFWPTQYTTANDVYSNRYLYNNIKYFSLTRGEVLSYARRGAPNIYTYQTTSPLRLLDMQNPETRETLLVYFSGSKQVTAAIKTAFQEKNGKIYRFSSTNTQPQNDISLKSICGLKDVDGFYTPKESTNPHYLFHSEIGLCRKAFGKLQLIHIEKSGLSVVDNVGRKWSVGNPPAPLSGTKRYRENAPTNFNNNGYNANNEFYHSQPDNALNEFPSYIIADPPKPKRFKSSNSSSKISRNKPNSSTSGKTRKNRKFRK